MSGHQEKRSRGSKFNFKSSLQIFFSKYRKDILNPYNMSLNVFPWTLLSILQLDVMLEYVTGCMGLYWPLWTEIPARLYSTLTPFLNSHFYKLWKTAFCQYFVSNIGEWVPKTAYCYIVSNNEGLAIFSKCTMCNRIDNI